MDFSEPVLEEIALEGLDGITASALWLRLETRKPKFQLQLDDAAKAFIWRTVISPHPEVEFFELPEARSPLVIVNRFDHVDLETGIVLEQPQPEEMYPMHVILDKEKGIMGSCATYYTRKNITAKVRSQDLEPLLSLEEVTKRWGEKLVVVASQDVRCAALYGPEVEIDMKFPEKIFCLLERVGRARYIGEVTRGKCGLMVFNENSKTVFYMRLVLMRRNLITVQPFNMKLLSGINITGKLYHLRRFFVERKPAYLRMLELLTEKLSQKPNQREVASVIRHEMGMAEKTFKKLFSLGSKYIVKKAVPYHEMYPDFEEETTSKKKGPRKDVIVLVLIKIYQYVIGKSDSDEECEDDEEDETDDFKGEANVGQLDLVYERPILHQVHQFIESKGEEGVTQSEVGRAFGVNRLDRRLLCRNLVRLNTVKKILLDEGRQRVQKFVAQKFVSNSEMHAKLNKEKDKILQRSKEHEIETSPEQGDQPAKKDNTTTGGRARKGPPKRDLIQSLMEMNDQSATHLNFVKENAHITYRVLKRLNWIIDAVKEAKFIDNIFLLQKKIIDEEAAEGHTYKFDRKSLKRLIERLAKSGQVKSIKTCIKFKDQERELHFVCEPSISTDDPLVKNAIEQAKLKLMVLSFDPGKSTQDDTEKTSSDVSTYALLKSKVKAGDMVYDNEASKKYGFNPRMKRLQIVHRLVWYLVYGYGKPFDLDEDIDAMDDPKSYCDGDEDVAQVKMDDVENLNLKVYCDTNDFRRYVKPLPEYKDYPPGWFLLGDVLLRLPVYMFCRIIRLNFKIKGLLEYLRDPVKRNIPISLLPALLRQQLMYERKYIFIFHEVCCGLAVTGLLSIGKRELKDKDQLFLYAHKNVSITDTTQVYVNPADRPVHRFTLDTFRVLYDFWFRLQLICLNTPLAAIKVPRGHDQTVSKALWKTERLSHALAGKDIDEIVDDGTVPGDNMGAGGIDSLYFTHLKRNWTVSYSAHTDLKVEHMIQDSNRREMKPRQRKTTVSTKVKKTKKKDAVKTVPVKTSAIQKGGKGLKRKPSVSASTDVLPVTKRGKNLSQRLQQAHKRMDSKDKAALQRMTKERVEWTPQEDSLILLCVVAEQYLSYPLTRRSLLVPWQTVRDIMHQNIESSLDKTSMACQRRACYVMKNPRTRLNVSIFLGEALQDKSLEEDFRKGRNYFRKKHDEQRNKDVVKALVERLRKKFGDAANVNQITLPDTLEEVYEKYHVATGSLPQVNRHDIVKTENDILYSVLGNIVQSSMLVSDKIGRAHELYHILSQYPEEMLEHVFNYCRSDGIITKIKKGQLTRGTSHRKSKVDMIPWATMGSYQIAQRFMYKWCLYRYSKSLFEEANHLLSSFKQTENGKPVGIDMQETGAYAALVVTMTAMRQISFETTIPEKIIVVESKGKKKSGEKLDKSKAQRFQTESDEEEENLIEEAEKSRQEGEQRKEQLVQLQEQQSSLSEDKKQDSESTFKLLGKGEPKDDLEIARGQCMNFISVRLLHPQDNLVIKSCQVKARLSSTCSIDIPDEMTWRSETLAFEYLSAWNDKHMWIHPKCCFWLLRSLRALQPAKVDLTRLLKQWQDTLGYSQATLDTLLNIHACVRGRGLLGIPVWEIKATLSLHLVYTRQVALGVSRILHSTGLSDMPKTLWKIARYLG